LKKGVNKVDSQMPKGGEVRSKMTQEKYIGDFRKQIFIHQFIANVDGYTHNVLQVITIAGAAIVPFLLTISNVPKLIPTIISGVVAVTAALLNFYRFNDRSRRRFEAYKVMSKEMNAYDLGQDRYADLDPEQAFKLFLNRAEEMKLEQIQNVFFFEESKQTHILNEQ